MTENTPYTPDVTKVIWVKYGMASNKNPPFLSGGFNFNKVLFSKNFN